MRSTQSIPVPFTVVLAMLCGAMVTFVWILFGSNRTPDMVWSPFLEWPPPEPRLERAFQRREDRVLRQCGLRRGLAGHGVVVRVQRFRKLVVFQDEGAPLIEHLVHPLGVLVERPDQSELDLAGRHGD